MIIGASIVTSDPTTCASEPNTWRAAASYVTGAHNFKVGYQASYLVSRYHYVQDDSLLQYTFTNRVPTSFTVNLQDWRTNDITQAAALYAQAADFNKTARFYYMKAQDAYYLANAQASYDDWRRARRQWDYFYRRK